MLRRKFLVAIAALPILKRITKQTPSDVVPPLIYPGEYVIRKNRIFDGTKGHSGINRIKDINMGCSRIRGLQSNKIIYDDWS